MLLSELTKSLYEFFKELHPKIRQKEAAPTKLHYVVTNNIRHDEFPADVWATQYVHPTCLACAENRMHYECFPSFSMSDYLAHYEDQEAKWQKWQLASYTEHVYFDDPVGDTRWKQPRKQNKCKTRNAKKQKVSKKRKHHVRFVTHEMKQL